MYCPNTFTKQLVMLRIDFGKKFTSANCSSIFDKYWHNSLKENLIIFDLKRVEWIAIEQTSFLLSWINYLLNKSKKVNIELADSQDITNDPNRELIILRRQTALHHLIYEWRLIQNTNNKAEVFYGDIKPKIRPVVLNPFYCLSKFEYNAESFDRDFNDVYLRKLADFTHYIEKELKQNTFLSYFDNHLLHYSIIKEFFSNVCQHAYPKTDGDCYLSLKLNRKIDKANDRTLQSKLSQRYSERSSDEVAYFQNNKKFKNEDFIEINFHDYGEGIVNTLEDKYKHEDAEKINTQLTKVNGDAFYQSHILEYAFLLFTSKYELAKDFEMHDYIPRGLYIIKEIVRRYGGLIIVRSFRGKLVFDFSNTSDSQTAIVYLKPKEIEKEFFPGTSISIVLPTKSNEGAKQRFITNKIYTLENTQIENLSILKVITGAERETNSIEDISESEKKSKFFELFFNQFYKVFSIEKSNKILYLLDFSGIETSSSGIFHKLVYFLTYCPLVSENVNICIYNLIERGANQSQLKRPDYELKSKGFFAKPIPCIFPDLSIEWIGVNNTDLETVLIDLWKGIEKGNLFTDDLHHIEGNCVTVEVKQNGRNSLRIELPSYYDIVERLIPFQEDFCYGEVKHSEIFYSALSSAEHNYNIVRQEKKDEQGRPRSYQIANGKFQKEFLTFVEKLYIKSYRRLLATHLILKFYCTLTDDEVTARNFNKVLTVTLSSQLLGKEVAEILISLRGNDSNLKLVRLSNYYDFSKEESFEEIEKGDKVLLVNDVVSTGNLSSNIFYALKDKQAQLSVVFALIDTRTDSDKIINIDSPLLSLTSYPIAKYDLDPFDSYKSIPIRVNPILNSPTTMSRRKANEQNVLMNPLTFVRHFKNDKPFLIGNFRNNSGYHSYYFLSSRMEREVKEQWLNLIQSMFSELKKKILLEELEEKRILVDRFLNDPSGFTQIGIPEPLMKKFKQDIDDNRGSSISENDLMKKPMGIDMIFYPFFSSISEVEEEISSILIDLNNSNKIEIYPIPRIITPKGWRFSFPPKFLNLLTENKQKRALILDDGSCTGETIVQMVDTLSFLDFSCLHVLSIVSRLEDFQVEFLTRIKEIQVKSNRIPIRTYFGTKFHIPVYNKNNHPISVELRELELVEEYFKKIDLPDFLSGYIEQRKRKISKFISPAPGHELDEIPKTISRKEMFLFRDYLGKLDSYRLYTEDEPEYLTSHGEITSNDLLRNDKNKLVTLAVLVHEPNLIQTVKNIYPKLLSTLYSYLLDTLIEDPKFVSSPTNLSFLVKAFSLLFPDKFISKEIKFRILECVNDQINKTNNEEIIETYKKLYSQIGVTYILNIINKNKSRDNEILGIATQNLIREIWFDLYGNTTDGVLITKKRRRKRESTPELRFIDSELFLKYKNLQNPSYFKFYRVLYDEIIPFLGQSRNKEITHFIALSKLYGNLTLDFVNHKNYTDYNNFDRIIITLQSFIHTNQSKEERNRVKEDFHNSFDALKRNVLNDLLPFLTEIKALKRTGVENICNEALEIIETLQKEIKPIFNNNFINRKATKEKLTKIINCLKALNERILNPLSDLAKLIYTARSRIVTVWDDAIAEFNQLNGCNETTKLQTRLKKINEVAVHPFILNHLYMHILNNKWTYARDAKCEYTISNYDKYNIKLRFKQSTEFIPEFSGKRGLSEIRSMLKLYGGSYYPISQKPNFIFEIILPINTSRYE